MGCGKPFCTCCETSYVAGLADGFKSGFETGYKLGHRNGYVTGYLDRHNNLEPLPQYKASVQSLMPVYEPPKLPELNKLSCGCLITCTCKPLLAETSNNQLPDIPSLNRLSCGCYGTFSCIKSVQNYFNPILQDRCTCIGNCICGKR